MDRNRPCHYGSNLKYKKCHLYLEQGFIKDDSGWIKFERPKIGGMKLSDRMKLGLV